MAIQYFIPEVWAAGLLGVLDKSLVYAGEACSNRDYEGDISAFGDTVHITSISDPTISTYTKDTNLSDPEALTDAEQLLVIDQAKAFNFAIDDIDKAQTRNEGALMNEALRRAGFGLRDKADQLAAAHMARGVSTGNVLGVVDATTATNVYDALIVPAGVKLDEANVPEEDRFLVIDPATHGKLRLDGRFIKVNESGETQGLRQAYVGEAGGFKIYKSNNAPTAARAITDIITVATTAKTLTGAAGTFSQGDVGLTVAGTRITGGSKIASVNADGSVATMDTNGASAGTQADTVLSGANRVAIAGSRIAHSFAEQILEVKAYSPEKRFGDALKGLHVYGSKVVRSTSLVVAGVKTS
jgi:hypothetical protein